MAPWQRQLGAVASLWLLSLGSLSSLAAPPAATEPSPELLAAYRVLDRLMAPASIEAPITLVVRPFHGAPCPSPAAEPVVRTQAGATTKPPSPSGVCLSGFELPPRLRQGFFVPFVVSMQRQADPESDPERPSAAIEGRTILLNATGLVLVRQGLPPGKPQSGETEATLPPEATCRIAKEFAAVQLDQQRQRQDSFDRIHNRLAERISKVASLERKSIGEKVVSGLMIPFTPFGIAPSPLGAFEMIHSHNVGHWINARLAESPHWQVFQQHAPGVATALKELRGLPEGTEGDPSSYSGSYLMIFSQAWGQIDGWFGIAAQEREEVIEAQRKQAQAEAVRLMAAAGIDPRSCADVFVPASAAEQDPAVLEAYAQARRKGLDPRSGLPSRFLPAEQKVVIFPRRAMPGNGSSGAGSKRVPPGKNR